MIAARWQAGAAVAVAAVALIAGLILAGVSRVEEAREGDALKQYSDEQAALHRLKKAAAPVIEPIGAGSTIVVDLPLAAAPSPPTITIRITATGLAIDDHDEQRDDLVFAQLTIRARIEPGTQLVIEAAEDVPYSRVIAVFDAAKTAGITHIALSTTP